MAIAALIRETLSEAQEYADKLELGDEDKQPDKDLKLEALLPVLDGTLMVKAHAHRADDIMSAIRIAKEFNLKMTIEHCTEGYMIADLLKKEDVGIILGPLISERCKIELRNLTLKAPKMMYDAGIKFAIMSDHPVVPIQHLRVCAALAVREGLPAEEALKAITINAAQITGLDARVGSIEVGKDGDIAVFSGDPLDIRTRCVMTVIEGKIVHDELR
jgi:imidazolonepropionase-like amidohydrolase